jgi:hypothetical protein
MLSKLDRINRKAARKVRDQRIVANIAAAIEKVEADAKLNAELDEVIVAKRPIVPVPAVPTLQALKVYRQDPITGIWVHDESFITTAVPAGSTLSDYAATLPRVVGRLLDQSERPF